MAEHRPIDEAQCRTIQVELSRIFREYDPDDMVIYRIRDRGNDHEAATISDVSLSIEGSTLTIEQPASDATFTNDNGVNITIVAWSDADPTARLTSTFLLRTYSARVRPLIKRGAPSFRLRAGETRIIDLDDHFQPSGINRASDPCIQPNDRLFYKVVGGNDVGEIVNSDRGEIAADENGTFLRLTGAAKPGNATVAIEATNTFNQKNTPDRAFGVKVESYNPAPVLTRPIADILANRNQEYRIDLSAHFTDVDDTLTYEARRLSGRDGIAMHSLDGSVLTIMSGDDEGVAGFRAVARDSNNQAVGDNFQIRVSNRPPVLQNAIANQTIYVGQPTIEIDLRDTFTDPDGDMLTFATARSPSDDGDTARVTINADGHTLEIRPGLDSGTGTFVVTAEDTKGGAASDGFVVTVATSDPPVIRERLGDQVMIVGTTNTIQLASRFSDEDNITYTVVRDLSDGGNIGGAAIAEGTSLLQLTAGVAEGTGTFLVRATDQSGQYIEDRFAIVVREADPVAPTVANNIMDFSLQLGMRRVIDLATVFQDIEGAIYKVERTGTTVTYELVGSKLTLIASQTTGVTTFVVTVTNRSGLESTDTFQVTAIPVIVTLRPPTIENRIEDRELETGATIRYNLHNVFKNNKPGTDMTFAVARDREQVTTVIHNGNLLQIEATGNGATVFDVTATNEDGSVTDRFIITGVHHPEAAGTIEDLNILARTTRQLNLLGLFTDTDGDSLFYTVRRAPADSGSVGEASVDGAILTVGGGTTAGTGMFIVTATDQSGNSVELPAFSVVVNAAAPMASTAIRNIRKSITFNRNASTVDLDDHFRDPGDTLAFTFETEGAAVALVSLGAGNVLTITPNGNLGTMTIKVTATDTGGFTAEQSFTYTVNRGPEQTATIPTQTLLSRTSKTIDLSAYYSHPDTITYSVSRTSGTVGTISLSGSMLTLTAGTTGGTSTIRVSARAGGETATQDFDFVVTAANTRPSVVGSGIPDQEYDTASTNTLDVAPYFTDANIASGDTITYRANVATTVGISVTVLGSVLSISTGVNAGTATVTVRATDSLGLFIEDSFTVTAVALYGTSDADKDITTSRRENSIWSDGTTLWLETGGSAQAYSVATRARDNSKDFNTLLPGGFTFYSTITSDGTTLWACDAFGKLVTALNASTGAVDASKSFSAAQLGVPGNSGTAARGSRYTPEGAWSDGTTLWVIILRTEHIGQGLDRRFQYTSTIWAYNIATKTRDPSKDFLDDQLQIAGTNNQGVSLFSDGTTLWYINGQRQIRAYKLSERVRDPVRDITIPSGIGESAAAWGNSETMWVVSRGSSGPASVTAYHLAGLGNPPTVSTPIPAQRVARTGTGSTVNVDLSQHFSDPDQGDVLTYGYLSPFHTVPQTGRGSFFGSDFSEVFSLEISGSTLIIRSSLDGVGMAASSQLPIRIRATDSRGLFVETPIEITVVA